MNDAAWRPPAVAAWEQSLATGTFEEVYATLEEVVTHLESGRLPLAESITCYELGVRLSERCEQFLAEAELRVSQLEEIAAQYTATAKPPAWDADDL